MQKKSLLFIAALSALCSSMQAGVYILIDPDESGISKVVGEVQRAVTEAVQKVSNLEGKYGFEEAQFAPHISLAFVSQEQWSVDQAKEQLEGLTEEFATIAQEHGPIDITSDFQNPSVEYWPGKFEVECGGSKKKNYASVVVKGTKNKKLDALVQAVIGKLAKKHGITQRFPFSAHLTLGRVYEESDKPVAPLIDALKLLTIQPQNMGEMVVKAFQLKGHDGSKVEFVLSSDQDDSKEEKE